MRIKSLLTKLYVKYKTPPRQNNLDSVTRIDVGCGNWKEDGYFGLDIFQAAHVDWVMDFNCDHFPFKDNSIEHAVSYHALEHVENLTHVLHEIWRVMKPNAQVFICVPYYYNHIHMSNIFHCQHFNEHSFRFFSSEATTRCLPERIWKFHFTPTWGLKGSANSFVETEFRCLKIEFDYYPEYRNIAEEEKENARLARSNVVHNICYYLQTIKADGSAIYLEEDAITVPNKRKWMISQGW